MSNGIFNRTRQKHSGATFVKNTVKRDARLKSEIRFKKNPRHGQHPERDQNEIGTRYRFS